MHRGHRSYLFQLGDTFHLSQLYTRFLGCGHNYTLTQGNNRSLYNSTQRSHKEN